MLTGNPVLAPHLAQALIGRRQVELQAVVVQNLLSDLSQAGEEESFTPILERRGLRIERIGYNGGTSDLLVLSEREITEIEIRLPRAHTHELAGRSGNGPGCSASSTTPLGPTSTFDSLMTETWARSPSM